MTTNNSLSSRDKFLNMEKTLNSLFFERSEMIKYIMLCLATSSNMIVIGKRGTAKTKVFQTVSDMIKLDDPVVETTQPFKDIMDIPHSEFEAYVQLRIDAATKSLNSPKTKKFFEVGINAYTIPDELFGPLDISALKQGVYRRVIANFAPNSLMCFLDELFKGKDQTLNSLLKFVLERKYFVNGVEETAKTKYFFGASNEFGGKDKLAPFEDRFQVWMPAYYLEDDSNFIDLMKLNCDGFPSYPKEVITLSELEQIEKEVNAVKVTDETLKGLLDVRKKFKDANIDISDRTFCRMIPLIKYAAWYDGRVETTSDDLEIIWVSCWDHNPDMAGEIAKTKQIIQSVIGQEREDLIAIQDRAYAVNKEAATDPDLNGTIIKLQSIKKDLVERVVKTTNQTVKEDVLRAVNNVLVLLSGMAQAKRPK